MIHFFVGTKAQFIKMVPIMLELNRRQIPYNYVDSGQHAELTRGLRKAFDIRQPDCVLTESGQDIVRISEAVRWFAKNAVKSCLNRRWLKQRVFPAKGICLIHGDTLSTLLGAVMAVSSGLKVGHVEAGLRSHNLLNPFPEEIIRLICMRLSNVLFAPSRDAFENLNRLRVKGQQHYVNGNTVIDAIRHIRKGFPAGAQSADRYALATCHRLETISDRSRISAVIELLNQVAQQMRVIFVVHKPTRKYLTRFGLMKKLSRNIVMNPMLDYPQFLSLIVGSEMVLTDGGSIQEECAFLNKKCLVIRKATERNDGLGSNAMLWGFDRRRSQLFIDGHFYRSTAPAKTFSPSREIVDHLIDAGYG